MQQFAGDLKHALRMFRESPGFTVTVVAALTLGIGVNTAIFSVVNAVLLKPVPYADPDTLVAIENTSNGAPYGPWTSPAKFMHWRTLTDVFSDVAAIDVYPRYLSYSGGDTPEQITVTRVSESYFRVLGAPVVRGRTFTPDEDSPGGARVAVLSYDFWQQRLGGANDALGANLSLGGASYTIVGVIGPNFGELDPYFAALSSGDHADVLLPFQLDPNTTDESNTFVNIARLKAGVTLAAARARVAASAAGFKERFPAYPETEGFTVLNVRQAIATLLGDPSPRLWVLLGAVGFVLLIACANVANLLLVRATGRAREIAIRTALGAGRGRIVRLLLAESLLLSLAGGILGLVGGVAGIRALLAVNTAGLPRLGPGGSLVAMDWRVVGFTLGLSLATGLVFGLFPALIGSRMETNSIIKDAGGHAAGGVRENRTRSALVTVEMGLAVVLLIGAALLIRTSVALGRVDPGFDASHVLALHSALAGPQYRTALAPTVSTGLERLRSLPGVGNAATTVFLPPGGALSMPFDIVGRPRDDTGRSTGSAYTNASSEGYFATLGIPVIRGRAFAARDDTGSPAVAVINETMAKRYWASGQDPLQDSILIGGSQASDGEPARRIVGIVGDAHYGGLDKDPEPMMYMPMAQLSEPEYTLWEQTGAPTAWVVRTLGDSAALSVTIKDTLAQATGLPVTDVVPMERSVSNSVSRHRLNMLLMSIFGGGAVLLAAIGIYGIMAYSVQQRVREIGIRMALGGDADRVKRAVVRQGMRLVVIGIAAGLVAAFYTANVLASWLFGVKSRDPIVFVAVPVVLALIALAAVWVPARRASRIDPLEALRYE